MRDLKQKESKQSIEVRRFLDGLLFRELDADQVSISGFDFRFRPMSDTRHVRQQRSQLRQHLDELLHLRIYSRHD
jgi:hypothetical protein